jgi:hypothetical protein
MQNSLYAVYALIQTVQPETFFEVVYTYVEEAQGTHKGLHISACSVKNKMANNIYGKDAQFTLYSMLNTWTLVFKGMASD